VGVGEAEKGLALPEMTQYRDGIGAHPIDRPGCLIDFMQDVTIPRKDRELPRHMHECAVQRHRRKMVRCRFL